MDKPIPDMPAATAPKQLDLFGEKLLDPSSRLKHKLIGQLFDTYWLIEYNDHLYIIDQHAAHEKVLYEKTVKSLKDRDYNSQMVEPPIILTLNPNEELLLNKYMEYFTHIGFEIEPFWAAGSLLSGQYQPICFPLQKGSAFRNDRWVV